MSADTVIITHGDCIDGMTAAWVLAKAYPDADILPLDPGLVPCSDPAEAFGRARRVVLSDICFDRAWMDRLAAAVPELVVLDHHRSAFDAIGDAPYARHLSNDRSGAGLALDWATRVVGMVVDDAARTMVAYVEDQDLWRFELPESRAIGAALMARVEGAETRRAFADLDGVQHEVATIGVAGLASQGRGILLARGRDVSQACARAHTLVLAGHAVPVTNGVPALSSDAGNALALDAPFAVVWHVKLRDGAPVVHLSLRAAHDGGEALAVAKALGGGGHVRACGATIGLEMWFDILRQGRWSTAA